MTRLETLKTNLLSIIGEQAALTQARNELTLEVPADAWVDTCTLLRDHADLRFETCIDLCGIDYSDWKARTSKADSTQFPHRSAVVLHRMSKHHNGSLRVRCFVTNDDFPALMTRYEV